MFALGYALQLGLRPDAERRIAPAAARHVRHFDHYPEWAVSALFGADDLLAKLPEGNPIVLTPDHAECFVPRFTPDDKTIVFVRRDGEYTALTPMENLKRLTEGNRYVEFRVSPKDLHGRPTARTSPPTASESPSSPSWTAFRTSSSWTTTAATGDE